MAEPIRRIIDGKRLASIMDLPDNLQDIEVEIFIVPHDAASPTSPHVHKRVCRPCKDIFGRRCRRKDFY